MLEFDFSLRVTRSAWRGARLVDRLQLMTNSSLNTGSFAFWCFNCCRTRDSSVGFIVCDEISIEIPTSRIGHVISEIIENFPLEMSFGD